MPSPLFKFSAFLTDRIFYYKVEAALIDVPVEPRAELLAAYRAKLLPLRCNLAAELRSNSAAELIGQLAANLPAEHVDEFFRRFYRLSFAPVLFALFRRRQGVAHPWDHLRHRLQTHFPKLYVQVLEPTLADLRQEHSAALAEERPLKARWVLLRGCGALAAAAVYQLGYSLRGRIAALWQTRSLK